MIVSVVKEVKRRRTAKKQKAEETKELGGTSIALSELNQVVDDAL